MTTAPAPGHDELLRSIVAAARLLLDAVSCSLAIVDEDSDELVFRIVSGGFEDGVVGLRVPTTSGIAGWAVSSGEAVVVNDVADDPRFARDIAELVGYVPRSIVAMPLETERGTIGVIEVLDAAGSGRGEANDLELLGVIARQAALAIESAQAYAELDGRLRAVLDGPEAAELAQLLADLGRLGGAERRAVVVIVDAFIGYATARSDRR